MRGVLLSINLVAYIFSFDFIFVRKRCLGSPDHHHCHLSVRWICSTACSKSVCTRQVFGFRFQLFTQLITYSKILFSFIFRECTTLYVLIFVL